MDYHSQIESRKLAPHHDYYVGYGIDGTIYHIRRYGRTGWAAAPQSDGGQHLFGSNLAQINRKLLGGTC